MSLVSNAICPFIPNGRHRLAAERHGNHLLEIMVPKHNQEGGTMVIPGYGRIGDEHDVLEYRDMVTIIRDRVQTYMKKGMSLAQIKAMKPSPTYEYETRFNRDPAWTAEMFVDAIYKSLGGK